MDRSDRPLVSIICSVHNAGRFLDEAVRSVRAQDHADWELLIGCDGCTDDSAAIAHAHAAEDPRVRAFELPKRGLSATRNHLLAASVGGFICMFDGDDVMPRRSVSSRLHVLLSDPAVCFADGAVEYKNADLSRTTGFYHPMYRGEPLQLLLRQDKRCFFGNTWMIRRLPGVRYHFDEELTHGEDLFFYISIAQGRTYDHTDEVVLHYRRSGNSLMNDLRGLENGYAILYRKIIALHSTGIVGRWSLKLRFIRYMALGYLKHYRSVRNFFRVTFRYLRM